MLKLRLILPACLVLACSSGGDSGPELDDTTPPAVSLTIPAGVARGPVTLSATASDAGGIRDVVFLVDGTAINTPVASAPYTTVWSSGLSPNGSRLITAVATDNAGNSATSGAVVLTADNFRVESFEPPSPTADLWPSVVVEFNAALDPSTVTGLFLYEGALDLLPVYTLGPGNLSLGAEGEFVPGGTYEARATPILERNGDELPLGATFSHTFTIRQPRTAVVSGVLNRGQQILLEGNGTVHLIGVWNSVLTHAACSASCGSQPSWVSSQIQGGVGDFAPSALMDQGATVHVLYAGGGLNYATCGGNCNQTANWTTGVVDTVDRAGFWSSMVVDGSGTLHAVYTNWKDGLLYYATCSASCTVETNWSKGVLPATLLNMQDLSLARDASGALHLVFRGQGGGFYPIHYSTCAGACTVTGNWQEITLETPTLPGSGSTLIADANGLHHAYYRGFTELRYGTCTTLCLLPGNWGSGLVDATGSGISIGMAILGSRRLIVYGGVESRLKYASCSSDCDTGGISWRTVMINQASNSGAVADAAFDANGQPRFVAGLNSIDYSE